MGKNLQLFLCDKLIKTINRLFKLLLIIFLVHLVLTDNTYP